MKLGISSYCLRKAIMGGEMDILGAIRWIADNGAEHVEIVPRGFDLEDNPRLVDDIRQQANDAGLLISNYAFSANFITPDDESYANEIAWVKRQVDIADRLGVKHIRHDAANRLPAEATDEQFRQDLDRLVFACREVADYAASFGIATSVENHGRYVNTSGRVRQLVEAVDRPNFRTMLDVGNFLVADEDPVQAVRNNIAIASMIHLKDMYVRPADRDPGEGWKRTAAGNFWRGAIVGHGDIDLREAFRCIKRAGFDGCISIEFDGLEECKLATKLGFDNAKRIWNES